MKENQSPFKFEGIRKLLNRAYLPSKISLLIIGALSAIWFLIRVIPKPQRASYPCMKAAAPFAASFITYLAGLTAFTFFIRKARDRFMQSKYLFGGSLLVVAFVVGIIGLTKTDFTAKANTLDLQPAQAGNEPIGVAKGIFPGRVVWVNSANATNEDCSNESDDYWWMDINNNQDTIDGMLASGLLNLTGAKTSGDAWDSIFHYYNRTHGKGNVGYITGEKIVVKINLNGMNNSNFNANVNTSPQICYSVLSQLVNNAGIAQADIVIGDPPTTTNDATYNKCIVSFPDVKYMGRNYTVTASANHVLIASDGSYSDVIPQAYLDAAYMINIPVLKKHHRAGISLGSKLHFGSMGAFTGGAWHLHPSLPCPDATGEAVNGDYGVYRCLVDIMGHEDLGGKTILFLVDGIWGSTNWGHPPIKWRMTPFNNDWPNSLFLSQDPVAIESVGYDFLYNEFDENHPTEGSAYMSDAKGPYPRFRGTDDFLHQAADTSNWPTTIDYDPEDDGTILTSLGAHEHWNNATEKEYSRNLKTGNGIELIRITKTTITKVVTVPEIITTSNTELPSNMVNVIFVDSNNVKWIGTDLGLARFDDSTWTIYTTSDRLINNKVNDIAYERTASGKGLWIATDGGLTSASFDASGITDANTYTESNSDLACNIIYRVAVDIIHNCWIGTRDNLTVLKESSFAPLLSWKDVNKAAFNFKDIPITDIEAFDADTQAYISTAGRGVARIRYDEIDGFTGASTYGLPWSIMNSDTVQSIDFIDTTQWFGTDNGLIQHTSKKTKGNFNIFTADSGLIGNNVTAVHLDNNANIWAGTDQGLSIFDGEQWYKYTESLGLVNNSIRYITSDMKGNVWVATAGGIQWFSSIPGVKVMDAPILIYPANASKDLPVVITMTWNSVADATGYTIQIDTTSEFPGPLIEVKNLAGPYYTTTLSPNTLYYWRVAATKPGDMSPWSKVKRYTTIAQVGIQELTQGLIGVKTYPNPAEDKLFVQLNLDKSQQIKISVYDIKGSLIDVPFTGVSEIQKTIQIDLSDYSKYSSGMYIIRVNGESFNRVIKLNKK